MTTAPHGLAWWVVVVLTAATLYGLYWLGRLSAYWHRPPLPAAPDAVPARTEAAPVTVPSRARGPAEPYRVDAGVAVSGPEPGRYARIGGLQ